jgi:glutathione S-transferase
VSSELYGRMKGSFAAYLSGIEQALSPQCTFLVGNDLTLADVCFVAEFCLFHNEQARSSVLETAGLSPLLDDEVPKTYPRSAAHFQRLLAHPSFVPDVAGYLEKIKRSSGHIKKRGLDFR